MAVENDSTGLSPPHLMEVEFGEQGPLGVNPSLTKHPKTRTKAKTKHSGSVTYEPVCVSFLY